jgi:hypothetical protein
MLQTFGNRRRPQLRGALVARRIKPLAPSAMSKVVGNGNVSFGSISRVPGADGGLLQDPQPDIP